MTASEQSPRALRRLTKRSQFQRAARGNRAGRSAFGLQVIAVADAEPGIGYTVTKKTGNSPERNRIKRRLRAAVTACSRDFVAQHDYVLVGRREALSEPFTKLVADLGALITRVHAPRPTDERPSSGRGPRKPR
ncbi:ribonuclease P protein component [Devosia oryziradicis]|uniref:Ribonuclease P protein component n=1 Tax=Devosia oryziradicis TaxID=2801335 RepID=A0ABX7BXC4_9HYPH|nr:ribonuclease P protein component [Devosia oryziradicis]QQR36152.1 ribonuclease P protein component [Devosia oryziradicis]